MCCFDFTYMFFSLTCISCVFPKKYIKSKALIVSTLYPNIGQNLSLIRYTKLDRFLGTKLNTGNSTIILFPLIHSQLIRIILLYQRYMSIHHRLQLYPYQFHLYLIGYDHLLIVYSHTLIDFLQFYQNMLILLH